MQTYAWRLNMVDADPVWASTEPRVAQQGADEGNAPVLKVEGSEYDRTVMVRCD
jgi:hypothetical protein